MVKLPRAHGTGITDSDTGVHLVLGNADRPAADKSRGSHERGPKIDRNGTLCYSRHHLNLKIRGNSRKRRSDNVITPDR